MSLGQPLAVRPRLMMQEAQRQGERLGIRAVEGGAAEHGVDPVVADIGPDAGPEEIDRPLRPVGLEHAGAAELQETLAGMPRQQGSEIEFALRIEAAEPVGGALAHQAIGPDDLGLDAAEAAPGLVVDHQQMVASLVEPVRIAAEHPRDDIGFRRHFLIEHAVTQALRPPDLARAPRQPHLERAVPAERARQRLGFPRKVGEAPQRAAGHRHHRHEAREEGMAGQGTRRRPVGASRNGQGHRQCLP